MLAKASCAEQRELGPLGPGPDLLQSHPRPDLLRARLGSLPQRQASTGVDGSVKVNYNSCSHLSDHIRRREGANVLLAAERLALANAGRRLVAADRLVGGIGPA